MRNVNTFFVNKSGSDNVTGGQKILKGGCNLDSADSESESLAVTCEHSNNALASV